MQPRGIEGCGGASGGVDALNPAAQDQHLEVMATLTNAGVVDTGVALLAAAENGREGAVKFLLQQMEWKARGETSCLCEQYSWPSRPNTHDFCSLHRQICVFQNCLVAC